MFRLEIIVPNQEKVSRFINGEEAVLGRDDDCTVVLEHDGVSRHHARIFRTVEGWQIEDLGSTNKIRIDDTTLEASGLAHRQSFFLGPVEIRFFDMVSGPVRVPISGQAGEEEPDSPETEGILVDFPEEDDGSAAAETLPEEPVDVPLPVAEAQPEPEPEPAPAPAPKPAPAVSRPTKAGAPKPVLQTHDRRVRSPMEMLAGGGTLGLILLQLFFAFGLTSWWRSNQQTRPPMPKPGPAKAVEPKPPAPDGGEVEQTGTAVNVGEPDGFGPLEDGLTGEPEEELTREERMLRAAEQQRREGDLHGAARQLDRLIAMSPDFLAARAEQARLSEFKGAFVEARDQWQALLAEGPGVELELEATEAIEKLDARIRLEELAQGPAAGGSVERKPVPTFVDTGGVKDTRATEPVEVEPVAPRAEPARDRVTIGRAVVQNLPASQEHDEMRVLVVELQARSAAYRVRGEKVAINVRFFDRDQGTGAVQETTARMPDKDQTLTSTLQLGAPQEISFGYVVPKGQRAREQAAGQGDLKYYGYVVEVYYDGVLQDRFARPTELRSR